MQDTTTQEPAGHPPEVALLQRWIRASGRSNRRVAMDVQDLGQYLTAEHGFSFPEATLRNMLAGKKPALAPPWRMAAVALVCGGTPDELDAIGRSDAAQELRDLRVAQQQVWGTTEVLEVQPPPGTEPDTARLLVPIPTELPAVERDQVRRTAQEFISLLLSLEPEERELALANSAQFAELLHRHRRTREG